MVRAMLGLIAIALGVGSAAMSLLFASTLGTGNLYWIWLIVAGAACAAKLTFPAAWAGKTLRSTAMLRVVFVIALIIDSSFTGGFTATTRDAMTTDLAKKEKLRTEQSDRVTKAKGALDVAPAVRGAELIEADLAAARRLTRGCRPGTNEAKGDGCLAVATLEKEQAGNKERARLQDEYDGENAKLEAMPEVIVYPEAHRLAKTLRQIGVDGASDERVSLFLSLLLVVFFELGSVTAARAAFLGSIEKPLAIPAPKASTPRRQPSTKVRGAADHTPAVLAALNAAAAGRPVPGIQKDAGGTLHLSQRALHQYLKVPQRALAAALAALEATGRAQVARGPGGTAIRLTGKLATI